MAVLRERLLTVPALLLQIAPRKGNSEEAFPKFDRGQVKGENLGYHKKK